MIVAGGFRRLGAFWGIWFSSRPSLQRGAKLVVLGIFKVGQNIYLEDTNKAPPGPRYNTRWETTQR